MIAGKPKLAPIEVLKIVDNWAGLQEVVKLAFRKIALTDVASKQTAVFDLGALSGAP